MCAPLCECRLLVRNPDLPYWSFYANLNFPTPFRTPPPLNLADLGHPLRQAGGCHFRPCAISPLADIRLTQFRVMNGVLGT
jgi:hypothetical protein